ncbi:MAG: MgtC/SapB family protein [Hydrogenothermaceae bacterium]|nr:MgtC/SapB family protein [Hydrogenothermaceae bacterium]
MEDFQLLYKILFSLGISFIIGMEREYKAKEDIFAGVRTFPLIALLGVISSFLGERYWEGILYIAFAGVVLFSLLNFYLEYSKDRGITTEISVLITFLVGVAVYHEYYYIAGFVGIFLMFILAIKNP